jgi:ectoine hydroxylase-related dioxygenase (phytanoyl-CoA dioxygenase family)
MLIYSLRAPGSEAPFHQDEAYWEFPGERLSHSVSCWMPLDEVTVESGCMQFVPGSHELEVLRHRRRRRRSRSSSTSFLTTPPARSLALPPGGATFHHCRTVHGTDRT